MARTRKFRYGFYCKGCGFNAKELYNCILTYGDKGVSFAICLRCMRRLGLKEKPKEEGLKE